MLAQDAVRWIVEGNLVKALLRAHLHQRQYVDQVQKVLKILAAEGGLQADHLELLWNLTEQVGHGAVHMLLECAWHVKKPSHSILITLFPHCCYWCCAGRHF